MQYNAAFNPSGGAAIVGLGMTEMTREYSYSATGLAGIAVKRALDDAGLKKEEIDGLFINAGVTNSISTPLQTSLGFRDLKLLNHMNAAGSTAGQMVQFASLAIQAGIKSYVVCVFADDPLNPGT